MFSTPRRKSMCKCACVCVCATCVVVCVCVCVCRMSASLRVCMWSLVRNHVRTPCLECLKKEKKKTLIGVAPGIIFFCRSRNEILETVTPFCHSPPQAEKKKLNSGPRDSGLAPHRRTPLEEPSPRTGSRNLGTRSWAPGTLGPRLGPQEPWDRVLNLIHFTSGPGSRNPNPGQPKSKSKQLLCKVS